MEGSYHNFAPMVTKATNKRTILFDQMENNDINSYENRRGYTVHNQTVLPYLLKKNRSKLQKNMTNYK